MRSQHGFTLWELIWTLALTGALLAVGVPALGNLLLDMRRTAAVNSFVTAVQLARSESAKTRQTVVLCKSGDGESCDNDAPGFELGWMVFVNDGLEQPPVRSQDERVLLENAPDFAGTIRSNRRYFEFRPYRRRSVNGTVTFCDVRGHDAARAVIISYTGRPRTAAEGPGRQLVCADLS